MTLQGILPMPGLCDLSRVVQERLRKTQKQFPASRPTSLDDFRIMSKRLSTIAEICAEVVARLETQGNGSDATAALKEVERALDWAEFTEHLIVNPIPLRRIFLFRAHEISNPTPTETYQPTAHEVLFDDRYRQQHTVRQFIESLGKHLGKTDLRLFGKSNFTSTSPILQWALHLTGKKARGLRETRREGQASFVVFDLGALSELEDVSVFRVSYILDLLHANGLVDAIKPQYQEWAKNCDEYIIMGRDIQRAVYQVIPWERIETMSIINSPFDWAYTLKLYRYFRDLEWDKIPEIEISEAGNMVVNSAEILAWGGGSRWDIIEHFIGLLLKPGIHLL